MSANRHRARNTITDWRGCTDAVDRGYRLSKNGREDVTGSIQEVATIEGSVLSLGLEVVGLGLEGVGS